MDWKKTVLATALVALLAKEAIYCDCWRKKEPTGDIKTNKELLVDYINEYEEANKKYSKETIEGSIIDRGRQIISKDIFDEESIAKTISYNQTKEGSKDFKKISDRIAKKFDEIESLNSISKIEDVLDELNDYGVTVGFRVKRWDNLKDGRNYLVYLNNFNRSSGKDKTFINSLPEDCEKDQYILLDNRNTAMLIYMRKLGRSGESSKQCDCNCDVVSKDNSEEINNKLARLEELLGENKNILNDNGCIVVSEKNDSFYRIVERTLPALGYKNISDVLTTRIAKELAYANEKIKDPWAPPFMPCCEKGGENCLLLGEEVCEIESVIIKFEKELFHYQSEGIPLFD